MKDEYLLYGVLLVLIGVLAFGLVGALNIQLPGRTQDVPPADTATSNLITTGTTDMGDVSIALEPVGTNPLRVSIAVNTHSVDLSQFDLKEITELEYEGGTVTPVEAPDLGGHHVSGDLVFDVDPKSYKITITGIPKVQQRTFDWR